MHAEDCEAIAQYLGEVLGIWRSKLPVDSAKFLLKHAPLYNVNMSDQKKTPRRLKSKKVAKQAKSIPEQVADVTLNNNDTNSLSLKPESSYLSYYENNEGANQQAQNVFEGVQNNYAQPFLGDRVNLGAGTVNPDDTQSAINQLSHNELERARDIIERIKAIFSVKVVGQERLQVALITTLIARGHILIESVPGLAKTTAASALCQAISGKFSRIQCTPDLMPNDIVGTQIYNYGTGEFQTQLGPVHANLVLLDEINRSSAKTQSAMLEAMQERQVTIGQHTYPLPDPFMVLATQNPIEEEGTYILPEAQMDRFLLKEIITYPTPEQEIKMLDMQTGSNQNKQDNFLPVSIEEIVFVQNLLDKIYVSPSITHYIISLINTTRGGGPNPIVGLDKLVRVGASPRGSIAFVKICQALAIFNGRSYVIPEDVKDMGYSVLRHRIIRTFDAMADEIPTESIIDQVFQIVPAP